MCLSSSYFGEVKMFQCSTLKMALDRKLDLDGTLKGSKSKNCPVGTL